MNLKKTSVMGEILLKNENLYLQHYLYISCLPSQSTKLSAKSMQRQCDLSQMVQYANNIILIFMNFNEKI